jgi:hypothetical protein
MSNKNFETILNMNTEKDNEFLRKCLSRSLIDSYGRESRKLVKISDLQNDINFKNVLIKNLKEEI